MTRAAQIEIDMVETYDPVADPRDYLFQDPDYRAGDEARLAAWLNDEWHFVSIRARATIKIPYGRNPDCWITSELFSPGLWGIESDSGGDYFGEVYRDERALLIDMLASLKNYEIAAPAPATTHIEGRTP
jgi:hypothetical protein